MKYILTSLLLATLLTIPAQTQCMDPEHQRLTEPLIYNQHASQPAEHCTPCGPTGMVFTLSTAIGGAISIPICAALNASMGFAALATFASGATGALIYKCCCTKTDNSQENE